MKNKVMVVEEKISKLSSVIEMSNSYVALIEFDPLLNIVLKAYLHSVSVYYAKL